MGIVNYEIWKCSSCHYEFYGERGVYEVDPSDFGTSHIVSPYYCKNCGNVKNLSFCIGIDKPEKGNEHLCHNDSDICENCETKMERLEPKEFKFLEKGYLCPKCGKYSFKLKRKKGGFMT